MGETDLRDDIRERGVINVDELQNEIGGNGEQRVSRVDSKLQRRHERRLDVDVALMSDMNAQ